VTYVTPAYNSNYIYHFFICRVESCMYPFHQRTARRSKKRVSGDAIVWYLNEKCGVLCKVGGTNATTLIVSV
jgi:hypothetical protein